MPTILLPKEVTSTWSVVACDQYTSEPAYWDEVAKLVGDDPSTLHIIFPEVFLDDEGKEERIKDINMHMRQYLADDLFEKHEGFVLVKRETSTGVRTSIIVALDLEAYSYEKGSTTLIRATEGTILDRLPPRIAVRKDAPLELPHIMVLIDDEQESVIERATKGKKLYDLDLMQGGGHITGHLVANPDDVIAALSALKASCNGLLYAMGDGNHSFATAKAIWEQKKKEGASLDDPARYALVGLVNVHDPSLVFEPIHRVIFEADDLLDGLHANGATIVDMNLATAKAYTVEGKHVIAFACGSRTGAVVMDRTANLAVGTLQNFLDSYLKQKGKIDYVHGEDVVKDLASGENTVGFLLPSMDKHDLFPTVIKDGALPRKTFSMGEAQDKRFYMECRKIM